MNSNKKPIEYTLKGFDTFSKGRELGFSKITYTPPSNVNISQFSNKNHPKKIKNDLTEEGFGSYFMDISYYNPNKEFGYN